MWERSLLGEKKYDFSRSWNGNGESYRMRPVRDVLKAIAWRKRARPLCARVVLGQEEFSKIERLWILRHGVTPGKFLRVPLLPTHSGRFACAKGQSKNCWEV
jgi:hypothetical protein